jgi:hypothetical protein
MIWPATLKSARSMIVTVASASMKAPAMMKIRCEPPVGCRKSSATFVPDPAGKHWKVPSSTASGPVLIEYVPAEPTVPGSKAKVIVRTASRFSDQR